jgi:hypothetical protein
MPRRRRTLRPAQEAEFVVSAEDVASAVYRATLESAVRAACTSRRATGRS